MDEKKRPDIQELKQILSLLGVEEDIHTSVKPFICAEDGNEYAVWLVSNGSKRFVLKQAKGYEAEVYKTFFKDGKSYAPRFFGECEYAEKEYLLVEYCEGEDLSVCDRKRLVLALDALIKMQDEFWQREELYDVCVSMDRALEGIANRGKYLASEKLERAYAEFVREFKKTPRTLTHDDLLPINLIVNDELAVLIDWEYGGVLPYLSSFARLIAHTRAEKDYLFYMENAEREFAIEYYYNNLVKKHGIGHEEYMKTLNRFLFYEYCEWIMLGNRYDSRDDERYGYYMKLADALAEKILGEY